MHLIQSNRWFKLLIAPFIAFFLLFTLQGFMSGWKPILSVAAYNESSDETSLYYSVNSAQTQGEGTELLQNNGFDTGLTHWSSSSGNVQWNSSDGYPGGTAQLTAVGAYIQQGISKK